MSENKLAKAQSITEAGIFDGGNSGSFYMPWQSIDLQYQKTGLAPEKLMIPREYHSVISMCYDFYQRGGVVATVINRLAEFSITEIRNGQRKTSDEANIYYSAVLHRSPSRLMRFLRTIALEYFLSGLIIPRVDWTEVPGEEISPELKAKRPYILPTFDYYPPLITYIEWAGWGQKSFFLKVPDEVKSLVRGSKAKEIKEEQERMLKYLAQFPSFVKDIKAGRDMIEIRNPDPILRKETSYSPYPTPYLFNVLESLVFRQQLRRMDYSVASRVINAILLVQEGSDSFPLTEETRENLDELKNQILARSNNPILMERLFILFSNHTTKLTWITPDVTAMLDQDKFRQANEELADGLGFARILITGEGGASDISTWAVQPQMDELRAMLLEWVTTVYEEAGKLNKFKNIPTATFKPIRLTDYIKTAAMFQAAYLDGSISRTTRDESIGIDWKSELELHKDELAFMEELDVPPMGPMQGSMLGTPGMTGAPGLTGIQGPNNGRPQGSQNVPTNNRNSGVKPTGQKPVSQLKSAAEAEMMTDEEVIHLMDRIAQDTGIKITPELLTRTAELLEK